MDFSELIIFQSSKRANINLFEAKVAELLKIVISRMFVAGLS
jgi:hypothetical protein